MNPDIEENAIFLSIYDYNEETSEIKLSVESVIIISVYYACQPQEVKLVFVSVKSSTENGVTVRFNDKFLCIKESEVPWTVSLCLYPSVLYKDTVITGLCAVARHICNFKSSIFSLEEHEDGLLGFRKSCLQAPNEVSVWTKYCEVDLLKTIKDLLLLSKLQEVPASLARFENHLSKPVRLHNIYKLARDLKKKSIISQNISNINSTSSADEVNLNQRTSKPRKWKSNISKQLELCNSKLDKLSIAHKYAEGPFLTLADIILYPQLFILKQMLGDSFERVLPITDKWLTTLNNMPEFKSLNELVQNIKLEKILIKHLTMCKIDDVSLYKCDPKRHNPKKRLFTKDNDIENALSLLTEGMEIRMSSNKLNFGSIHWNTLPDDVNPNAGHLPGERTERKTQQLENLCLAVMSIAVDGDIIVDFCCGSGHLGIVLAYLLPKCTIIMLENKEQSLLRARERVHRLRLQNVYFYQCNLDFFIGKFDIGIGLHACGIATDLVLDKCLKSNAKFVLCPCCYGSLHATDRLVYPRSSTFSNIPLSQYLCIGHAADQTHDDHPLTERGERCMALIDSDRGLLAQESGYEVTLSRLQPLSCTPKNNLLIGIPKNKR